MKTRQVLRWMGVEDEHGLFAWRLVLLAAGFVALLAKGGLVGAAGAFVGALLLSVMEGIRQQERVRIAMETADSQARARLSAEMAATHEAASLEKAKLDRIEDAEIAALRKDMAALQEKMKLLSTPDQMEKLQAFFKSRLGVSR